MLCPWLGGVLRLSPACSSKDDDSNDAPTMKRCFLSVVLGLGFVISVGVTVQRITCDDYQGMPRLERASARPVRRPRAPLESGTLVRTSRFQFECRSSVGMASNASSWSRSDR